MITISTNTLLLLISCSIVIVSFMVSMNAPGGRRMAISFLFSSILLGVNLFVGLEYYNTQKKEKQALLFQNQFSDDKKRVLQQLEKSQQDLQAEVSARKRAKQKEKELLFIGDIINVVGR